ncbi:Dol-P-Glc:Glc(2)Man(9)GlcNAc(2)-PP-Dol alpha-1,2-glucosyltransferase [Cladobotryum mycophilum]|uniref:Dol-P-Glc:Glc(2)Man(9)GlcNAc(2)-PP-Dol alpha-1,2-glucosyltransferase n=1 Tax=Cladobotryum mycophilum TaxID=491253 RepID=A0ABR0S8G0_9HYPO
MASSTAAPDSGKSQHLGFTTWAACAAPIAPIFHFLFFGSRGGGAGGLGLVLSTCLAAASFLWLGMVSEVVPEPYLDEIFHIPQAQKYCKGKFLEWDDKITTPPGLYWISIFFPQMAKSTGFIAAYSCDPKTLRATSAVGLIILSYLTVLCRREMEARLHQGHSHSATKINMTFKIVSPYAMHTAFNIALFPLLFFFSGLYYTDVVSTAVVLVSFLNHLVRVGRDRNSFFNDGLTVFLGVCGLVMRQTNVFWVVVFMGGLEAVHAVKSLRPERATQPLPTTLSGRLIFFAKRYAVGQVHDVPLHMAYPEDMLFTIVSLVIAAICNPLRILRRIWPYIAILISFAGFVVWNGGVVLGDKSNHVATIHLTQMLYIWAFFAFFSLPLFVPYVIQVIGTLKAAFSPHSQSSTTRISVPSSGKVSNAGKQDGNDTPAELSYPLRQVAALFNSRLLWPIYLLATFILSVLTVRYNTIIHPFTLADNRHYMFYVFRYTIRRATWIRYALILPYTLGRWMVWGILAGCSDWMLGGRYGNACSAYYHSLRPSPFTSDPFERQKRSDTREAEDAAEKPKAQWEQAYARDPLIFSTEPVPTSTGLVFLLATTLSLVTAPLVEPRYFIIPWVMWRLMVPAWRLHDHNSDMFSSLAPGSLLGFFRSYDMRLVLETVWFIAINLATGYIFLFKPYIWKAEDGTILDQGRLQRFMW